MKFALSSAILAIAGLVSASTIETRRSCPQATRFGVLTVSPTTVSAGDRLTLSVDLTCAVQNFDIVAQFIDYTLEVPAESNDGFEPPIVLARRTIRKGALSDSVTVTVPHGFFKAGAPYNVVLTNIHNINGTDGSPVTVEGGVLAPITVKS